jgi:hypothetical protein
LILHCTQKLAARLPDVSVTPLEERSPAGSWHAHLVRMDRRQCVLFMHDETRFALFAAGLRKPDFADLEQRWFRPLLGSALSAHGCSDAQVDQVQSMLGDVRCDRNTDRSVLATIRVAVQDLEALVWRHQHVLDVHPVEVALFLADRPITIHGEWSWPRSAIREWADTLSA